MSATLKEQKEAFVTGHNGTTPWELIVVCAAAPLGIWLYQLLKRKSSATNIFIEAGVLLFPMALSQTSLLYPWGLVLFGVLLCIGMLLRKNVKRIQGPEPQSSNLAFVTCYRSTVMYLTFVAILAVDFHIFPRRFAKTEIHGYGLMDLGAGSFVVAAGLVSPRARSSGAILTNKALLRMIPLLVIGMIRLLTTKGLEYQEHVSEYGVHWNFFFTLAVMSPLAAMMPFRWEGPAILVGVYQWLLTKEGFQRYIEEGSRTCVNPDSLLCNFFAANREGIFGVIGYLTLFMAAELLGKHCVWNGDEKRTDRLIIASAGLWILHQILISQKIPVSRRSTNITFCCWTLAHNFLLLTLICLANVRNVPPIFAAVNRHGLIVFVVANLLTGVVNLSMNTLAASDEVALLVVFLYLCAVGAFSLMVDYALSNIKKSKRD